MDFFPSPAPDEDGWPNILEGFTASLSVSYKVLLSRETSKHPNVLLIVKFS